MIKSSDFYAIAINNDFWYEHSEYFNNDDQADKYFDELRTKLWVGRNLSQGVVKSIAWVVE